MLSKLLPVGALGLLLSVPALSSAAPEAAVSFRARATVTHAELAENTARGLATPVGIASAAGQACEIRCVLEDPDGQDDGHETLRCQLGEVRSVVDGFTLEATWTESGASLQTEHDVVLGACG